jgi:type III pantothenate kinase
MSVNLCIDWGNSRVKASIFGADDKIVETRSFVESEAADGIDIMVDEFLPTKCILCTVTATSNGAEVKLKDRISSFVKLDNNTPLPIMNAYSSPGTLGADRLALAVAAYILYPEKNAIVISLGTCITYNFVLRNKAFRGGAISPGLRMRLQAMSHFTNQLPVIDLDGETLLLGYDTATCMRSGAVNGMAAELDGMIDQYKEQYHDFNAILTGGDLPFFAKRLRNQIFADPDLLLKGLNIILKHNVPYSR